MIKAPENIGIRNRVRELMAEAQSAERKMTRAQNDLKAIQNSCQHDWFPVRYDPIIREAYTMPGDPPGTMGIDWRGPCFVPREERQRWTRECRTCGLVQETTRTQDKVEKIPTF